MARGQRTITEVNSGEGSVERMLLSKSERKLKHVGKQATATNNSGVPLRLTISQVNKTTFR